MKCADFVVFYDEVLGLLGQFRQEHRALHLRGGGEQDFAAASEKRKKRLLRGLS